MDANELKEILRLHRLFMRGEPGGCQANLRGANLRRANLQWADLRWANLQEANLQGADLRWANLQEANLQGANLRWANLRLANLHGAAGDPGVVGVSISNLMWPVWISPHAVEIKIGCQSHPTEQWVKWTPKSKEIVAMHGDASAFWARHKKAIIALASSMGKGK